MKKLFVLASFSISCAFGRPMTAYGQTLDNEQLLQISKASGDKALIALANDYAFKRSNSPWGSKDGQYTVRGSYLELRAAEGKVVLLLEGKQEKAVSLSSLSENDIKTIERVVEIERKLLAEMGRTARNAFAENALLKTQLSDANSKIKSLEFDLAKASKYVPSNRLATEKGIPEIVTKRLEVFGEDYLQKSIRLTNVSKIETSTTWTSSVSQDGRESLVGFTLHDSDGEFFQYAFAKKSELGEFLLSLNKTDRVNLSGKVIRVNDNFGILVERIEKLP